MRTVWTALDAAAIAPQLDGATVVDGHFVLGRAGAWRPVCPVADVPGTWDGTAEHVVKNALTALALADALGLATDVIADGLRAFNGDPDDNPGRANRFIVNGAVVVVDYAHNAHGCSRRCRSATR